MKNAETQNTERNRKTKKKKKKKLAEVSRMDAPQEDTAIAAEVDIADDNEIISLLKEETIETETCAICSEGISNPICPDCLASQMQAFFGENVGKRNHFVQRLAKIAMANVTVASWCVLCKKPMAVCTHCYSSAVHDELLADYPELEHEFLLHFNYFLKSN